MKQERLISIDSICIDKTFKDFMESIRDEVDKLLNESKAALSDRLTDSIPVTIELDAQWYDFSESDFPFPPQMSCIVWATVKFGEAYFAIGDFEFARYFGSKKRLDNLVQVRLVDCLWSIENAREEQFGILRRFYPDWKTSDDYLH